MSTTARVAAFIAGLAVVFVAALGIGRAVGPADSEPTGHEMADGEHQDSGHEDSGHEDSGHEDGGHDGMATGGEGLTSSDGGYTLTLAAESLAPGRRTLAFTIEGPDGAPVMAYDQLHERSLHLIAVRRDLTGYQHLHPILDASGQWSTPAQLRPGLWRLIADFVPTGAAQTTLGTDLQVGTSLRFTPLGPDTSVDSVVDGYDVSLDGHLHSGQAAALTLTVARDSRPVTDLEPYLGSYGHLVMLRAGDLAYVHVHAVEGSAGPELEFEAEAPEPGRYRLFLDFRHGGTVRTAEFTVTVP